MRKLVLVMMFALVLTGCGKENTNDRTKFSMDIYGKGEIKNL